MSVLLGTHQLVIIAKPGPDQPYCQLATAFQHCPCDTKILHPCLNVLRAFADERHRFGILQELAFATGNETDKTDLMLPADTYYQASEEKDDDCRFPYITATLVSSMGSCVDQGHTDYRCSLEAPFHDVRNGFGEGHVPLYMNCAGDSGGGRGDVIVGVIDITDLRKLRYCILNMPIWCVKCGLRNYDPKVPIMVDAHDGKFPEWEIEDYKPSSGEPLSYRVEMDFQSLELETVREGRDVEALEMLQAYPLIDVATLANCWPSAAWQGQPPADSTQLSVHPRGLGAPKRGPKSLADLAQDKIIDAVILGLFDDLELFDYPMLIRGFTKSFLAVCASRADELAASEHQDFIAAMLARLLEGATCVDLYPFRQLPLGTIREILGSNHLRAMKILNLSGLFVECPGEIWTTLDAIPHDPEVVYILSPPSVDRAAETAEIKKAIPHYFAGGKCKFWDRVGSKKIILSASISTALKLYGSSYRKDNYLAELTWFKCLRELARGDTMRLRLWPWM